MFCLKRHYLQNIWFDSKSEAGKFTSGLYSYPTTYVVDKNGNIVGQPIVGAITSSSQEKQLNKLIDEAIKNSKNKDFKYLCTLPGSYISEIV